MDIQSYIGENMIIFPGDYVLHNGRVYRVVNADGDMKIQLDTGDWITADESDIQGIKSAGEVLCFFNPEPCR